MHPFFLCFDDTSVETTFRKSYLKTLNCIDPFLSAFFFGSLMLATPAEDVVGHTTMSWRHIHLIQLLLYVGLSMVAPHRRMMRTCTSVADIIMSILLSNADNLSSSTYIQAIAVVYPWMLSSSLGCFGWRTPLLFAIEAFIYEATLPISTHSCTPMATVGLFLYWVHETVARQTFLVELLNSENAIMDAKHKGEAELAHLLGNYLYQIGRITTDSTILAIIRRAERWSSSRRALTSIRAGTYAARPTLVHLRAMFCDIGFEIEGTPEKVVVDETCLLMCLEQARSNAVKYGEGTPSVHATFDGSNLCIDVMSVNRVGVQAIPEDHSFFELGVTTGGQGLGLNTVHLVCKALGGKCALRAMGDSSTRLTIVLPATCDNEPVAVVPPKRIVLIDDEPFSLEVLRTLFEQALPHATITVFGEDNLDTDLPRHILDADPQLIVSDHNLSENTTGVTLARDCRALGYRGVFFVYTASTPEEVAVIEKVSIDTVDAVFEKTLHVTVQSMMLVYHNATCVISAPLAQALTKLLSKIHTDVPRIAHTIKGAAALEGATRIVNMASLVKTEPTEAHVRALQRVISQSVAVCP